MFYERGKVRLKFFSYQNKSSESINLTNQACFISVPRFLSLLLSVWKLPLNNNSCISTESYVFIAK